MTSANAAARPRTRLERALDTVERIGNKLPDPALLFILLTALVALLSWRLSSVEFAAIDPRSGKPVTIVNMLSGVSLTGFMSAMVETFVKFHPLGVVLVAMLGIGVADATGFIKAGLRALLQVTTRTILTPMVIAVGILSHVAVDAGYVLVIPLGAVIYMAAGRHPLAGIAAAFAGVSGGFSATFVPSSLDPLLQGITQAAAQVIDPSTVLNPLNNYFFTSASSVVIIAIGWLLTDKFVEPRLKSTALDTQATDSPKFDALTPVERRALRWSLFALVAGLVVLAASAWPGGSPWRAPETGELTVAAAPLMKSIVALIFVLFLIPGIVYGYLAGTVRTHRDVIKAMADSMAGMGYYIVIAFFMAQFIAVFGQSNLGTLLAVEGAQGLRALGLPLGVTVFGIILLTAVVNLFIGSASAKWALLAPIFVPMLMQLGISPDLTQAAYRIGDSSTNIITPLMPYFPLVVVYCQRYIKNTGLGTVIAIMLPYSVVFLVTWTVFLMAWWGFGMPLGLQSSYTYGAG
jgi:aminobenzoyl-glutamate transport protein